MSLLRCFRTVFFVSGLSACTYPPPVAMPTDASSVIVQDGGCPTAVDLTPEQAKTFEPECMPSVLLSSAPPTIKADVARSNDPQAFAFFLAGNKNCPRSIVMKEMFVEIEGTAYSVNPTPIPYDVSYKRTGSAPQDMACGGDLFPGSAVSPSWAVSWGMAYRFDFDPPGLNKNFLISGEPINLSPGSSHFFRISLWTKGQEGKTLAPQIRGFDVCVDDAPTRCQRVRPSFVGDTAFPLVAILP